MKLGKEENRSKRIGIRYKILIIKGGEIRDTKTLNLSRNTRAHLLRDKL